MKYAPTSNAMMVPMGKKRGIASKKSAGDAGIIPRGELKSVFRDYRWSILLTYFLFNAESLIRLAQPLLLGIAINDLLGSSYQGLIIFAIGHVAHMTIRLCRQMYDTRTFTRIYADRASALVKNQRDQNVDLSRITARSTLSQEFIVFFEEGVPLIIRSLYSVVGALVMLLWYDSMLLAFCAGLSLPAYLLYQRFRKRSFTLSRLLHDQREKEVDILAKGSDAEVLQHYKELSKIQIKLSDAEAGTIGMMEFFVLAVMLVSLIRFCSMESIAAGDIFAVFRYVMMFIMGLDSLPKITQTLSKLRDIQNRIFIPKK